VVEEFAGRNINPWCLFLSQPFALSFSEVNSFSFSEVNSLEKDVFKFILKHVDDLIIINLYNKAVAVIDDIVFDILDWQDRIKPAQSFRYFFALVVKRKQYSPINRDFPDHRCYQIILTFTHLL
jgi:hypothetical protein